QIATVYNGEIYNYKEIKKELEAKGHIFQTDCDTEVIVHGYEQWGTDCVHKFNGMFAFAVWDNRKEKMWVVRDRLGIKPLYYYSDNKVFVCASEIKAILKTGLVKPELNDNVLDAYFSVGYVPGPETMFSNIKKLMPGHWLMADNSEIKEREYWDCNVDRFQEADFSRDMQRIRELLEDAVQKRLMSDVLLGAFLSGGLDSSMVVALMSNVAADPVNTFTVAYHEGESEEKYARVVADKFETSHHVFYLEAEDFFSSLKTLVKFAEEPIVEPAAIALYHIAKLAREKVTVLLSGEGSDEIFGGYYLYQYMLNIDKARKFIPNSAFPLLKSLGTWISKMKHRKYLDWLTLPLSCRYQGTSSYLTDSQKKILYSPEFFDAKSDYLESSFEGYFQRVKKMDSLSQMLYVDTKTWLVDDLLVKADKMTMAASVELRVPFLDHILVEAAMALPVGYKINSGEGKHILKKID
ncbi:asparagine synthase (glutamine-hydrolyzing), partial [bacterium]|nr:asparagine synthase (glutamine-hydrolyzing) [bacterium]